MRLTLVGGGSFLGVIDSRRHLAGSCDLWYLAVSSLHRLFVAIATMAVNEDESGGTAINPCVWSAGAVQRERMLGWACEIMPFFLDLPSFQRRLDSWPSYCCW